MNERGGEEKNKRGKQQKTRGLKNWKWMKKEGKRWENIISKGREKVGRSEENVREKLSEREEWEEKGEKNKGEKKKKDEMNLWKTNEIGKGK